MEQYNDLFKHVNKHTGQHITDILTLYYYYFGFQIQVGFFYQHQCTIMTALLLQEELGLKIPAWAEKIYPYPLLNLTMTYYDFMFAHKDLKRMAGGIFFSY